MGRKDLETKAVIRIKTGVRDEKRSRLWTNPGGPSTEVGKQERRSGKVTKKDN